MSPESRGSRGAGACRPRTPPDVAGFFSVRLAPGVRVSASPRGLRAHVGPRGARLHVGGGGTGVSTGAGPFTYYEGVGGSRTRSRPHRTGPTRTQIAQAEKLEQAKLIVDQLTAIEEIHRQEFASPVKATAELPALPPFGRLLDAAEAEHLRDIGLFHRAQRREAREQARAAAENQARTLLAHAQAQQAAAQAEIDRSWDALLANDEALVLTALEQAFEDNEAPAAAVGVAGDALSLAVLVPSPDVLPDRMPGTTSSGNLSLRKMTKSVRAAAYLSLVAGHVVVSVKEALAQAPGIESVAVVAVREDEPDVYGNRRAQPLLATRLSRQRLAGVRWESCSAWDVIDQAGTDTLVKLRGAARELVPLDLSGEPELSQLVEAIDLRELSDAATGSADATIPPKDYPNCTALNKAYPHGVGRWGAHDKTTGTPVTNFKRSNKVYRLNDESDRDKDGIACEKR